MQFGIRFTYPPACVNIYGMNNWWVFRLDSILSLCITITSCINLGLDCIISIIE